MLGKIDYSQLPEHMQEAARLYLEHGVRPGDFLTSVICNDLFGAMGRADCVNQQRMFDICSFFYNEAPSGSYGSEEKMSNWMFSKRSYEVSKEEEGE